MKRGLLVFCLLLLLTACSGTTTVPEPDTAVSQPTTAQSGNSRPTPTNAPAVEPSPTTMAEATDVPVVESTDTAVPDTPTPAPEIPANTEPISDMTINADDGTPIAATLYLPDGTGPFPGVILLHMLGSNRAAWGDDGLTSTLTDAGYALLAVDMRGHGGTPGERDWAAIEQDMYKVWQTFTELEQVDAGRTAVIGASIGSNMALVTGDNIPEIKTVILLSPGLDYRGVTTDDHVVSYGDRPLLIVASEEDSYSADSSRTLEELAANGRSLILQDAGHGTFMLFREDLQVEIVAWLDANLK